MLQAIVVFYRATRHCRQGRGSPARDLPVPREWVKTPAGMGDLLCWRDDGAEALVRLFRPAPGQPPPVRFAAECIVGEIEQARRECRRPVQAASAGSSYYG